MKTLGVIGGAGPLASALFYESVVCECYRQKRPVPKMVVLNYPFARGLTEVESSQNSSSNRRAIEGCLATLADAKASVAVLVCNTMHLELRKIDHHGVVCTHIPELVMEEILRQGRRRVLLLASQRTGATDLYHHPDIEIVLPEKQGIIDAVIDRVLEGTLLESDSGQLEELIASHGDAIDGVILGCTDLPVLHHRFPIKTALYREGLKNRETGKEAAPNVQSGVSGRAREHGTSEDRIFEAKLTPAGTDSSVTRGIPIFDSVKIPAQSILRFL
ncbi:MAG: hypothetical protein RL235_717 [Chlamydiota bacterium]|jgi:aspartate racemase